MEIVKFHDGLAYKQAKYCVTIAFLMGLLFSGIQIYLDYFDVRTELNGTVNQVLKIMTPSVSEAVDNENKELCEDLVVGMFQYEPIFEVDVLDSNGETFILVQQDLKASEVRWISDSIFGESDEFFATLELSPGSEQSFFGGAETGPISEVGRMRVLVDTYYYGFAFLKRAGTILVTGVLRNLFMASLLLVFFHHYLTRPFLTLEKDLNKIDRNNPAKFRLKKPNGHEHDEFGVLVSDTNELLQVVDDQVDNLESQVEARTQELEQKNQLLEASNRELSQALSNLERVQEKMIVQEKLASLGTLTSGIAHEIKNPLNFVNNFSLALRRLAEDLNAELSLPKEERDEEEIMELSRSIQSSASRVERNGKRIDKIVNSMVLHASETPGERRSENVNLLLEEYLKLSVHSQHQEEFNSNIQISTDYDDSIPNILAVSQDVRRVFLNVFSNSFYALYQKQQEWGDYEPKLDIKTRKMGQYAEIRIRDNGIGIEDDTLKKVFEPFNTTKPPGDGPGLGLYLSYDIIVHGHGGTFEVTSEPGVFTENIICLPLPL